MAPVHLVKKSKVKQDALLYAMRFGVLRRGGVLLHSTYMIILSLGISMGRPAASRWLSLHSIK